MKLKTLLAIAPLTLIACNAPDADSPPPEEATQTEAAPAKDDSKRATDAFVATPSPAPPSTPEEASATTEAGESGDNLDSAIAVKPPSDLAAGAADGKKAMGMEGTFGDKANLGSAGSGKGGGGVASESYGIGGLGVVGTKGSGTGAGRIGRAAHSKRVVPRILSGTPRVRGASGAGYRAQRGAPAPVAEPQRREQYTDHGVNTFVDTSEDAHSTFSIDVDTGSYTIARRKLQGNTLPPKAAVRVEEFVNYFDYAYPAPTNGDPFAVHLEAAPTPLAGVSDRYLLRVGVQGKTIRDEDRKPVHLTFLVDVSGSMRSTDKIGLVKNSLTFLTENLQTSDTVAIATYAGSTRVVLDRTSVADKEAILTAIRGLGAGGSTAMGDGLKLAYGLAMKDFNPDHESRVIVLSDGDANVGASRHSDLLDQISSYVKKGVTLSTVGFGMGNYRDTLMEQLANKGNGNYSYIDSMREAEKVFGSQVDGTLQVIAKDVKIQVEFNPAAVARYRLVGYENRDIADKDFRNDAVDAGEIGAGHTVTAIYELDLAVPVSDLPDKVATVRVRNKTPRGSKAVERAFSLTKSDINTKLARASKDYQFAAAVVAFAEKLRQSPYAKDVSYDLIEEIAQAATKGQADRKEFVTLVQAARRL